MKTLLPFLPDQNAACDALRRWSEASADPFDQFHAIATILEEETDLAVELGWSGEAVARGQIDFWQLRLQLAHLALDAFLPRRMSAFYASTDVARETFLRTALWTVHFGASFGWTEGAAFTLGLLSRLGQCPLQELLARVKPFWRAPSRDSLAALVASERQAVVHDELEVGAALLQNWGFPAAWGRILQASRHPLLAKDYRDLALSLALGRQLAEEPSLEALETGPLQRMLPADWPGAHLIDPRVLEQARHWVEARLSGETSTPQPPASTTRLYSFA